MCVVLGRAGSEHRMGEGNGTERSGMWTGHLGDKGEHLLEQLCVSPSNTHPNIWEKSHYWLCPLIPFMSPLFV